MSEPETVRRKGLENVVVADMELSCVYGEGPELLYRGIDARELAEHSSYEETAYLLWNGELPTRDELDAFCGELAGRRSISRGVSEIAEHAPDDAVPMDVLRTAVSATSVYGDVGETAARTCFLFSRRRRPHSRRSDAPAAGMKP